MAAMSSKTPSRFEVRRPRAPWDASETAALVRMFPQHSAQEIADAIGRTVKSVYQKAHDLGLKKPVEWIAERARARSLDPNHGGRAHQFKPGHETHNKGKPFRPGGRSRETQFKPGRKPSEARNYAPIGSLRVTSDGLLERKITDDQSIVPARRWVSVHRLVWEATHGPVPSGHLITFRQGMATTVADQITLDRLELITRAENMNRNTIHNYPPEIIELTRLRATLNRRIGRLEKSQETSP